MICDRKIGVNVSVTEHRLLDHGVHKITDISETAVFPRLPFLTLGDALSSE